ncbi:MAG: PIN domain-containing protein [Opitutaceae bacterium]|nr:PIN domain-containing protein [Opitutaceae bacterium]
MILPEANLLIYAHNALDPRHEAARRWWDERLAGPEGVDLAWVVLLAFIRLSAHPRVFHTPFGPAEALERVEVWLSLPHVAIFSPKASRFTTLNALLRQAGTAGNLTTDAHLAALAIDHNPVLHTTDADFARFPDLKWKNPLRRRQGFKPRSAAAGAIHAC